MGSKPEQEPPPFVQPPPAAGSWQDQYVAHVNFFRTHFSSQLAPRPAEPYSATAAEEFVEASEELYCQS
ncbi:hypothetical protein KFE25_009465 [Diacronema lutheri]|uniref:Uncharacterized protein n=1 Tax=Diacronema lutheri TaxID=2081491 RepID=A0A8J5XUV7_DIALT|nr:hypothetical protein KFE25_009465 [Diacronema lutheri]